MRRAIDARKLENSCKAMARRMTGLKNARHDAHYCFLSTMQ